MNNRIMKGENEIGTSVRTLRSSIIVARKKRAVVLRSSLGQIKEFLSGGEFGQVGIFLR